MAVSASLWSAADTQATLLSTELNSLGSATTAASSGAALDNTTATTARRQYGMLELNVTFGSAPTTGDYVSVYLIPAPDGTNFDDVVDPMSPACLVANILVRAVTSAQKIAVPIVIPGPFKFKAAVKNNTGVSFPASGSTLMITAYDNEQQ